MTEISLETVGDLQEILRFDELLSLNIKDLLNEVIVCSHLVLL